jgi:hypothetical protein
VPFDAALERSVATGEEGIGRCQPTWTLAVAEEPFGFETNGVATQPRRYSPCRAVLDVAALMRDPTVYGRLGPAGANFRLLYPDERWCLHPVHISEAVVDVV